MERPEQYAPRSFVLAVETPLTSVWVAFEPFKQTSPDDTTIAASETPKPSIGPLILPILTFIGCQLLVLALGVWKCKQMGLVPSGTGDWLQFETRAEVSLCCGTFNKGLPKVWA